MPLFFGEIFHFHVYYPLSKGGLFTSLACVGQREITSGYKTPLLFFLSTLQVEDLYQEFDDNWTALESDRQIAENLLDKADAIQDVSRTH